MNMIATNNTVKMSVSHSSDSALLQESNDRANAILSNSKEIILTLDLEQNVIAYVNDAISILGYKPEEWINRSYKSIEEDFRQKFHELMRLAVQSELQVKNQQIYFTDKYQ